LNNSIETSQGMLNTPQKYLQSKLSSVYLSLVSGIVNPPASFTSNANSGEI